MPTIERYQQRDPCAALAELHGVASLDLREVAKRVLPKLTYTNSDQLSSLARVVQVYVLVVLATVAALIILSVVAPHLSPDHAWGHAVIVAVFAVLLPLRMRSVRAGSRAGLRAVGIISAVLVLVNVVEALIPGFLPTWMRIEMIGVVALMAVSVALVAQIAARDQRATGSAASKA